MAGLNIFRVLLRHPKLARAVHDLLATLLWNARLDVACASDHHAHRW